MLKSWVVFFGTWFALAAAHAWIGHQPFNPFGSASPYLVVAAFALGTLYRFWADMQDSKH
jgi:hypothetical protein